MKTRFTSAVLLSAIATMCFLAPRVTRATGDFDGDGTADIGCYDASGGNWYMMQTRDGFRTATFGYAGTVSVVGDFDGDGRDDYGCYYAPGGNWYIMQSRDGFRTETFGYSGTVPVVGDFDGDGKSDFGCYYAPGGNWYIMQSRDGFRTAAFGYAGTVPVVGDFDGDGRDDYGCYYAPGGNWYIMQSRDGFRTETFGYSGTVPVVGDFDGDGKSDFGCYYAPGGNWYLMQSRDGFRTATFGYDGTVPVVGDFDGDGKSDYGCYYAPGGNWYLMQSRDGFRTATFGYSAAIALGGAAQAQRKPVDYLIVDLSAGPSASIYPVSHQIAVPAGGWTDEHKTTKLVLRRIAAGTFAMGSPVGELGREPWTPGSETQHQVTLTQPFYVGIFEVTQKQWERVMGDWPSYFTNATVRNSRPVETVSYNDIRGASAGTAWPANGSVDADSFMGKLRARTGKAFDLPTEAQWEYAGRAGTTTALNSARNLTATEQCPNLSEVGRYWHNGGSGYVPDGNSSVGSAKVGSYLPSAWGLYDIHGNAWEWCLDWYGTYPGTVSDPKGPDSGMSRVYRGGGWDAYANVCRAAYRGRGGPGGAYSVIGFRVAAP
jgi:formylglycine-generating enzyme required for sulfatase activity